MANVKITELPVLSAILSTDVLPIVQGGTTYQITVGNFGQGTYPVIVSPPSGNSFGSPGDKAGSIAFSTLFLYYCTDDYTTGGVQIWQRIARDATAW
tara:strand:+ start:26 stop:316 length:291 start_codon:yes stop_codon:yes gene_type:complete